MARSLGLSAYLAFARRQAPVLAPIQDARPQGQLVWLHCADPARAHVLAQAGLRLAAQRGQTGLILTTPPGHPIARDLPAGVVLAECPSENPADIQAFLYHWRPDACLWLGPWLRPALIEATNLRGIPQMLLDADEPALAHKKWRLMPEPITGTLPLFNAILSHSTEAANRLTRLAPISDLMHKSGPLLEDSPALPCNETDLEGLGEALGGRPVWLASQIHLDEMRPILMAHRTVLRLAHRTLLVIVPDDPTQAQAIHKLCQEDRWNVASWDDGELPDPNTQVLISEDRRELGLWYRVAPVTLMGSSLVPGQGGRNPLEAAALGSAVLYGPGVRDYLDSYSRLASAGAARIVKDADSLATALGLVTAPDQAAAMAHAGWEIVSEGAEVSDQIIALAQDALDERGAS
ncbi:glycosyltransferase N-terminal domain-containing protein [uncultured Shimia sp.]|uniref:3-deoxy-D-manno-octulosonic acid transferase n=1 Tax=uncultured Shimia sp. TaxID=573152 RepID=UPI00260C92FF|nr:glycosyltransferase N-terminal domain-containing protein [uncultured Shimia sp.]